LPKFSKLTKKWRTTRLVLTRGKLVPTQNLTRISEKSSECRTLVEELLVSQLFNLKWKDMFLRLSHLMRFQICNTFCLNSDSFVIPSKRNLTIVVLCVLLKICSHICFDVISRFENEWKILISVWLPAFLDKSTLQDILVY